MRACLTFFGILAGAWLLVVYSQTRTAPPLDPAYAESINNINKMLKHIDVPKKMICFSIYCDGDTVPKGLKENILKFLQSSDSDIVSYGEYESRKNIINEVGYMTRSHIWLSVSVRESISIVDAITLINSIDGVQSCRLR